MAVMLSPRKCEGKLGNCGMGCCGDLRRGERRRDTVKTRRRIRRVLNRQFLRDVSQGNY